MPYKIGDKEEMYVKSKNEILNKELKPGYQSLYYGRIVKINSSGFRDYEYDTDKPNGVFRIVLLGDSMCFGQGLALEDIYPKVLERILNKQIPYNTNNIKKIEVLNFSVPGYNTIQEYEYLKTKAIHYKPDLIILDFFLNDILPLGKVSFSKSSPKSNRKLFSLLSRIKGKSYFAQYILSRIAVLARRIGMHRGYISEFHGSYEENSKYWLECQKNLLNLRDFAEDNGSEIFLVIIPFLSDLNEYHPLKGEINIVTNFGKANSINALSLFPYFYGHKAESLWINPINGHPNQRAHAIMAEVVSKHILKDFL